MNVTYRTEPIFSDIEAVRDIVTSSGFFLEHEIPVAVELVQERLDKGLESEYYFVFAEIEGKPVAYACFGPIPCTINNFDLYWIAAHNSMRGKGIGSELIKKVEEYVKEMGGRSIYIETSGKAQYVPTRKFYDHNGYIMEATLKNYYDLNDDKVIYSKEL